MPGPPQAHRHARAIAVVVVLSMIVQPWAAATAAVGGPAPEDGGRAIDTSHAPPAEARASVRSRGGPSPPSTGVGLPAHYADWAMLEGGFRWNEGEQDALPLGPTPTGCQFIMLERDGRAYRFEREGTALRIASYGVLFPSDYVLRGAVATESGGGTVLVAQSSRSSIETFWTGNLSRRTVLQPSSASLLGVGDWDGDGQDDVWVHTTSKVIAVLNLTTGAVLASTTYDRPDGIRQATVARLPDGNVSAVLLSSELRDLLAVGGPDLATRMLHVRRSSEDCYSFVPVREDGTLTKVAFPGSYNGVLVLDLITNTTMVQDAQLRNIRLVAACEDPSDGALAWFYVNNGGQLMRSNGTGNVTTASVDVQERCLMVPLEGPGGDRFIVVASINQSICLVDPDGLGVIASGGTGPSYVEGVASGQVDLRGLGITSDAVTYGSGLYVLDGVNRTLRAVEGDGTAHWYYGATWWKGGPSEPLLVATWRPYKKCAIEVFNVTQGNLTLATAWDFPEEVSWLGSVTPADGDPILVAAGRTQLWNVHPATRSQSVLVAGVTGLMAVGDVDADGGEELLCADALGMVHCVEPTNGSVAWRYDAGATVSSMLAADVDGDGAVELVLSLAQGPTRVLDPSTLAVEWTMPEHLGRATSMTASDVDADGHVELVMARTSTDEVLVVECAEGRGRTIEWWCGLWMGDAPKVQGTFTVAGSTWLPLANVHPFAAVTFTDPASLGDFVMTGLSTDAVGPTEGDDVHLDATLRLDGGFPTYALVELYDADPSLDPGLTALGRSTVHLTPGGAAEVGFTWRAALGNTTLRAVVNGAVWHLVAETDHTNDVATLHVEVARPYASVAWTLGLGEQTGLLGGTAVVDGDGDGVDELLLCDGSGSVLCVRPVAAALPADGEAVAQFDRPRWRSDHLGAAPISIAVGDLDLDGTPECVVGTADGLVHVLRTQDGKVLRSSKLDQPVLDVAIVHDGPGPHVWVAVLDAALPLLHFLRSSDLVTVQAQAVVLDGLLLEVIDLDGDGVDEVVVVGRQGHISIVHPPVGAPSTLITVPLQDIVASAIGDLDGDGIDELAVASANALTVLDLADPGGWREDPVLGALALDEPPTGVAVGDWDWDGREEVLLVAGRLLALGPRPGSPSPWEKPVEEAALGLPTMANGVVLGTFGRDDHMRAALPLRDGRVALANGLDGTLLAPRLDLGVSTLALALGDVDDDVVPDVVVATALGGTLALDGVSLLADMLADRPVWAVATADWDGDGVTEIALQSQGGDLLLLGPDGSVERTVAEGLAGTVRAIVALDVGGDGVLDLAWAEDDWTVRVHEMSSNRTGQFSWASDTPVRLGVVRNGTGGDALVLPLDEEVAMVDLTTLGIARRVYVGIDVVALTAFPPDVTGHATVVVADATGTLTVVDLTEATLGATRHLGRPVTALLAGDLDLDGRVEVVAALDDGSVRLLRGDALQDVPRVLWPMASNVTAIAAADIDLDGAIEVVLGGWSELVALRVGDGRPLPDLTVSVLEAPLTPLATGERFGLSFRVSNRGTVPTGPFAWRFLEGDVELGNGTLGLGPMGRADLAFDLQAGDWCVTRVYSLLVDALDEVREFDESNNLLVLEVQTGAPPGPDVRITIVSLEPRSFLAGDPATLTVLLENTGSGLFDGRVELTASSLGAPLPWHIVHADPILLEARGSVTLELGLGTLVAGADAVEVSVVDTTGRVLSSVVAWVEVGGRPEVVVATLQLAGPEGWPLFAGEPFEVIAGLRNDGSAPAEGLLLVSARPADPTAQLTAVRFALAPGGSCELRAMLTVAGPGFVELVSSVPPLHDELGLDDNGLVLGAMVFPHPSDSLLARDLLATRRGPDEVHVTLVIDVGEVPDGASIAVRVYALGAPGPLNVSGAVVEVPPEGWPELRNWTRATVANTSEMFDALVDLSVALAGEGLAHVRGMWLLAVVGLLVPGEEVPATFRMAEVGAVGDAKQDGGPVHPVVILAIACITIILVAAAIALARSSGSWHRRPGRAEGVPDEDRGKGAGTETDTAALTDAPGTEEGSAPSAEDGGRDR